MDRPDASGKLVQTFYLQNGATEEMIDIKVLTGEKGRTDFIKIYIPGKDGKRSKGPAPTMGILGRLGGLGARPERLGFVSDGDGALAALAIAAKLLKMRQYGDLLEGDVMVSTHICPDAPTRPHFPVPFMGSPIDMDTCNKEEITPEMDAIVSIDTTKGNKVINTRGFAISPTIKDGYILPPSDDFLELMKRVTGRMPFVFPVAQQDITPYGNELFHINSILQPSCVTTAPVLGVAITAELPIAGWATGASREIDVEEASRFVLEVAKDYTSGRCKFYDPAEFDRLQKLYGSLAHFQKNPEKV